MRFLLVLAILSTGYISFGQTTPFTLNLNAAKFGVKVGGPVDLSVLMTNTSNHDVDCTTNGSNGLDRSYDYEVLDERGHKATKLEKEHHGGSSIWPCVLKQKETIRHKAPGLALSMISANLANTRLRFPEESLETMAVQERLGNEAIMRRLSNRTSSPSRLSQLRRLLHDHL